jgi:hypothetical protein
MTSSCSDRARSCNALYPSSYPTYLIAHWQFLGGASAAWPVTARAQHRPKPAH